MPRQFLGSNAPAHRRRANDVRLSTETRPRRSVQPAGSAFSLYALQTSGHQCEDSAEQNLHDEQTPNPNHENQPTPPRDWHCKDNCCAENRCYDNCDVNESAWQVSLRRCECDQPVSTHEERRGKKSQPPQPAIVCATNSCACYVADRGKARRPDRSARQSVFILQPGQRVSVASTGLFASALFAARFSCRRIQDDRGSGCATDSHTDFSAARTLT
jgi:hypothetical protein